MVFFSTSDVVVYVSEQSSHGAGAYISIYVYLYIYPYVFNASLPGYCVAR